MYKCHLPCLEVVASKPLGCSMLTCLSLVKLTEKQFSFSNQSPAQQHEDNYTHKYMQNMGGNQNCDLQPVQTRSKETADLRVHIRVCVCVCVCVYESKQASET